MHQRAQRLRGQRHRDKLGTTTAVTITSGGFTVTGATGADETPPTDTTKATFVLDGFDTSFTLTCSAINLDCRFTTPTGDGSGTYPINGIVEEGTPGTLSFTGSTLDGDTDVTCANSDPTGTYTLDDPTEVGPDTLTVSP